MIIKAFMIILLMFAAVNVRDMLPIKYFCRAIFPMSFKVPAFCDDDDFSLLV